MDYITNIKNLDPNNIKLEEKLYKNIISNIGYVKPNSVEPFSLTINKANSYIETNNGHKYLTLVPTGEGKDKLRKYEEIWSKIKDLIRSTNNN